jgi:hypothetical protein
LRTILLFLFFLATAFGQNATLSGLIADASGASVPHATVVITGQETGTKRQTASNEAGLYTAPSLESGLYTVTVQAKGFQSASQTDLKLEVAQNARLDFRLQVGSVEEKVVVREEALMNATDGSVSTVVDRTFVQNLPMNGRTFQSLIALTPGTVLTPATYGSMGQFSVNGQRTDSNYFMIDGVSANFATSAGGTFVETASGALPALSATGGTNGLVSVDAMQEFRVQTSTFAPE